MQPQHFMEFHDDQLSKRLGFSRIQNPFSLSYLSFCSFSFAHTCPTLVGCWGPVEEFPFCLIASPLGTWKRKVVQFFLAICQAWEPSLLGVSSTGNFKELFHSIKCNKMVHNKERSLRELPTGWENTGLFGQSQQYFLSSPCVFRITDGAQFCHWQESASLWKPKSSKMCFHLLLTSLRICRGVQIICLSKSPKWKDKSFICTQMNLEGIMLSEVSLSLRQILYDLTYIGILKKKKKKTWMYRKRDQTCDYRDGGRGERGLEKSGQ